MKKSGRRPQPFSSVPGLRKVTIHAGGIYAAQEPAVVQTLLGSCVSVCLLDLQSKIGGMNHILLPGKADLQNFDAAARYGVNAMELLISKIQKLGGARRKLVAKVFGGANIMNGMDSSFNPGFRNGVFAMEFLEAEGVPLLGHDIGGYNARRIYLRTDTGEVFMKRIPRYNASRVVFEEKEYQKQVQSELSRRGRVALFDK